jgi:hypothetical protein
VVLVHTDEAPGSDLGARHILLKAELVVMAETGWVMRGLRGTVLILYCNDWCIVRFIELLLLSKAVADTGWRSL